MRFRPRIVTRDPPLSGPEDGCTDNITGDVVCEFSSADYEVAKKIDINRSLFVRAVVDTSRPNEVTCLSPSRMPGIVRIRLSSNGQQYSTDFGLFEYYNSESLTTITPLSGLNEGTNIIVLDGTNFMNTTSLSCLFEIGRASCRERV